MADTKISGLTALTGANTASGDLLTIVDISDTTMAATGTNKSISLTQLQSAPVSAGTANGVLYLNGSKVATSGSALTFDGTNFGIGTTSPGAKLDVSNSGVSQIAIRNTSGTTKNTQLIYADSGGNKWQVGMDVATNNGSTMFQWYYAPNAVSYLNLDSSGNLGLGVTPSAWTSYKALQVNSSLALMGDGAASIYGNNAYYNSGWKYANSNYAALYVQNNGGNGAHAWYNAPSGTIGNAITLTQAMTLDSSGNLGIGVTSVASKLHVKVTGGSDDTLFSYGANQDNFITAGSSGVTIFRNLGTERARIDSSGNLLVGTTSTNPTNGFVANQNAGAGFYLQIGHPTGTGSGVAYSRFMYNQTEIGSITQSGTTAVLYNTTSDQRLKENIANADSASSLIDSLQVRKFDWKADGSHQRYGFIAQELVSVAPEAVHQPINPEEMMAVDYSKLVPMLVKEIQSLRARVAALES